LVIPKRHQAQVVPSQCDCHRKQYKTKSPENPTSLPDCAFTHASTTAHEMRYDKMILTLFVKTIEPTTRTGDEHDKSTEDGMTSRLTAWLFSLLSLVSAVGYFIWISQGATLSAAEANLYPAPVFERIQSQLAAAAPPLDWNVPWLSL